MARKFEFVDGYDGIIFSPKDQNGNGGSYIKPWYYQLPEHLHDEFSQNNDFPIHLQKEKEGLDIFRSYGLNAPNSRLLSITLTGKLQRVLLISNVGGISLEKLGSSDEELVLFERGLSGFLKDMKEKYGKKMEKFLPNIGKKIYILQLILENQLSKQPLIALVVILVMMRWKMYL